MLVYRPHCQLKVSTKLDGICPSCKNYTNIISDYELIQIVEKDYTNYTEEALIKYKAEFRMRKLYDKR
jgi:hypothetical protein